MGKPASLSSLSFSHGPFCKSQAPFAITRCIEVVHHRMGLPTPHFARLQPGLSPLPSLAAEATRLARFVPPFRFTSFFAPEDTLLCVIAAEGALEGLREGRAHRRAEGPRVGANLRDGTPSGNGAAGLRIVELTTGSGLVGLRMLDLEPEATLVGVDIDDDAPKVAGANAFGLGLADRARFEQASIWDGDLERGLLADPVDVLVCNPPYVPEPPGANLPVEAGAGPDGAAHVRRVIEIADMTRPSTLVLSWCSLCDPAGIVADAEQAGYRLNALYVVAIADGEYSGGVHGYLRGLSGAFLSDQPDVIAMVAPDGAARFAYLLLAGVFANDRSSASPAAQRRVPGDSAAAVDHLMHEFVRRGEEALIAPAAPFPVTTWLLDRWDEISLRAFLHGPLSVVAGRGLSA